MAYEQTLPDMPATLWQADAQLCAGHVTLTVGQRDQAIPAAHNSPASTVPGLRYRHATFRVATMHEGLRLIAVRGDVILRVDVDDDVVALRCELGSSSDNSRAWTLNIRGPLESAGS